MSTIETAERAALTVETPRKVIHPRWVRITHWINALAILMMIGSGWQIYNASPLFAFTFPRGSRSAVGLPARCCGISRPCGCW